MNFNKAHNFILSDKIYGDCLKDIYMKLQPLNSKQQQNTTARPIAITPLYYLAIASLVFVLFIIS
ncbi:MAG: hypothetical protein ACI843_002172 [Psychrobacter glaciei]|jgi:hypothetical protein